jgi:hypothetical protein
VSVCVCVCLWSAFACCCCFCSFFSPCWRARHPLNLPQIVGNPTHQLLLIAGTLNSCSTYQGFRSRFSAFWAEKSQATASNPVCHTHPSLHPPLRVFLPARRRCPPPPVSFCWCLAVFSFPCLPCWGVVVRQPRAPDPLGPCAVCKELIDSAKAKKVQVKGPVRLPTRVRSNLLAPRAGPCLGLAYPSSWCFSFAAPAHHYPQDPLR